MRGISALFCGIILMDMKAGKRPNLILIGLGMAFFGFVFLSISDFHQIVSIPLSALYAVAGLLTLAKGIKDWHDGKRNRAPKVKKPMKKKIYIGIGLLVGGFFSTIILFNILPLLMGIGHVMVVVGFVFLGRGIAEMKNGSSSTQIANNYNNVGGTTQVKTEYCARCEKNLAYLTTGQIFEIDGVKYCADCKAAIEQDIKNQHTVCSVCGIDLPVENMHVIDDALLCHSCFLKKYGNIDSYEEEENSSTIEDAVSSLRKQIVAEITKNPALKYQLANLLWQDAANCFPKSGFQWDGAWFEIDLKTGKLSARVSTYPNQFGANYEDSFSLSAREFNRITKQFNMSKELQVFKSEEDWAKLFDDNLKAVISSACAILQKKEDERKAEEIKKYAVKIPANYANNSPNMVLSEITLEISQRYAARSIKVINENGKYQLVYVRSSLTSSSYNRYPKELSAAESIWLEKQVEVVLNDPDEYTWQSLPGGDTMNIVIKKNKGKDVCLRGVKPIRKYSDLQNELENLAQYGSKLDVFSEIKLGEYFDGGFVEHYITLCKDKKGFYIHENSWHYNAHKETFLSIKRLEENYFKNNTFEQFVKFLKNNYPKYEVDRYVEDDKELQSLFSH